MGADDLLFPRKRGTPHSRQNLNRRVLAPAVARAADTRVGEAGMTDGAHNVAADREFERLLDRDR
jgi:hypothetical protein